MNVCTAKAAGLLIAVMLILSSGCGGSSTEIDGIVINDDLVEYSFDNDDSEVIEFDEEMIRHIQGIDDDEVTIENIRGEISD